MADSASEQAPNRGSAPHQQVRPEITETERAFFAAEASRFGLAVGRELGRHPGNWAISPVGLAAELGSIEPGIRAQTAREAARKLGWQPGERARTGYDALVRGAGHAGFVHSRRVFTTNPMNQPSGVTAQVPPDGGEGLRDELVAWLGNERLPKEFLGKARGPILAGRSTIHRSWLHGFASAETRAAPFGPNGREVPTMSGTFVLPLAHTSKATLIELPYQDPSLALDLLLPESDNGMAELERELSPDNLRSWFMQTELTQVSLRLPRFAVSSTAELGRVLRAMGTGDLLWAQPGAAAKAPPLRIDSILHHAELKVDEYGSGGGAERPKSSATHGPVTNTVAVNRPFLLVVRDVLTGALLMVARVAEP